MPAGLAELQTTLKLLSDPVRLRLVALLSRAELAVQELVAITGMQQSRVSNHLALLRRARLVRDRREGTWCFYALCEPGVDSPLSAGLFAAAIQPFLDSEPGAADRQALQAVLEQRRSKSREAHDRLASAWQELGQDFTTGSLRAEILAQAVPRRWTVADLGCGTGFLSSHLELHGLHVIAVDHSARMLATARRQLPAEVELRRGELDALPLQDGEVDAAFANLVWHHVPDLDAAAAELFRVLRPGGVGVISDLMPHEQESMRQTMGDLRLGMRPELVAAALGRAGFRPVRWQTAADRYLVPAAGDAAPAPALPMFLVRAEKPLPAAGAGGTAAP